MEPVVLHKILTEVETDTAAAIGTLIQTTTEPMIDATIDSTIDTMIDTMIEVMTVATTDTTDSLIEEIMMGVNDGIITETDKMTTETEAEITVMNMQRHIPTEIEHKITDPPMILGIPNITIQLAFLKHHPLCCLLPLPSIHSNMYRLNLTEDCQQR